MEIDNKNSEEKEAKQPAEIPEKEKDHVLRTAVILATVIIVLGGIVVAVRLNNPKQDTTKGRKILSEMDRTDVGKVNKKIQKLEEEERVKEEAADNRSVSEKFADCLILGDSITQGLYEYGVLDEANVQADRGTEVSEVSSKKIEEHAVTFAAGLATSGLVPVVAIYSSFLQRAYDQILHDVCLQKLHVIFAIDRSGLVGADGDTHQGIFDTAFLSHIPNMTIIAPKNRYELTRAMEWAVAYDGPVALKYSRGEAYYGLKEYNVDIEYGRSEMIHRGQKLAIVAVGNMVQEAEKVYDRLLADGTNVTFVNARFLKPIDTDMIDELSKDHKHIVVIEEEIKHGGYGSLVEEYVMDRHLDVDVTVCAIEDTFVQHGSVEELRRMLKLDADSLYDRIKHIISTDCTE